MEETSPDQTAAAVKIQAIQRGKEDRAKVEQMKQDKVDQQQAAVKIQAVHRGKEARAEFESQKDAATKIQAIQRGNTTRKEGDAGGAAAEGGAADAPTAAANGEAAGSGEPVKKKKKKKKKKRISIAIIGPTGSGKTEQAQKIAARYDAVIVGSLDQVLDWAVAEKKECAADIVASRTEGRSVSDETVVQAVAERVALDDVRSAPAWVIEGFPQNRAQADELLELAGGKKSPIVRFISLNADAEVLLLHLSDRKPVEGEEVAPAPPTAEAMASLLTEYNATLAGIQAYCTDNKDKKITFLDLKDASGTADSIFKDICAFLGPSASEDEAAAKTQAQLRGKKQRDVIAAREKAATRIQAQIRGKEERLHAKRRVEIQDAHEEDEILSAITNASSGAEGKKIQNVFPRNKTKDLEIKLFVKKVSKIKSKNEQIQILQQMLDKPKITALLNRDFQRSNKKGDPVINYSEFETMVADHGGKLEERKEKLTTVQIAALQKEFELRPGAFKELFDDMDVDESGGVDLDEFREAFGERAELWGYGDAFSATRTKEIGLFEAIDVDHDNNISWKEFERYLTNVKNQKQKEAAAAAAISEEQAKISDLAQREREIAEANAQVDDHMEDDDECELENLRARLATKGQSADAINGGAVTENIRRRRNPKSVQVSDSVAQRSSASTAQRRGRGGASHIRSPRQIASSSRKPPLPSDTISSPEAERPPMGTPDRKIMLVKILRKYRKGLHTTFEFYSKANIGSVKQFTFDQVSFFFFISFFFLLVFSLLCLTLFYLFFLFSSLLSSFLCTTDERRTFWSESSHVSTYVWRFCSDTQSACKI